LGKDVPGLVDRLLGGQAGVGHAAARVGHRRHRQVTHQRQGLCVDVPGRLLVGLALALALALALGVAVAVGGVGLVVLLLDALVGLDGPRVGQPGRARRHGPHQVAILAGLGPQGADAGDGHPLAALVVLGVELLGVLHAGIGLAAAL